MSRYFISQPMRDKKMEDVLKEREAISEIIRKYDPEAVIIPMLEDDILDKSTPLECLGLAINRLGGSDLAVFASDWWTARGCFLEHACCKEYDIPHVDLVLKASSKENHDVEVMIRHSICDIKNSGNKL